MHVWYLSINKQYIYIYTHMYIYAMYVSISFNCLYLFILKGFPPILPAFGIVIIDYCVCVFELSVCGFAAVWVCVSCVCG